ncbi:MAG TPA: alanine--tRNA ligase-related protein, partial [Candidatus Izemoplasmatales bacterium]|nr:alanine--tRNA ligase-related protein [Candidatus Izemoplasmatales bacterium]
MKRLKGHEIREIWLNFFKDKNHHIEESASLIPNNDPTLLWMNSGVAALKQYFDGRVVPKNPRMVNVQKCIRTNDIENVGNTAR